MRLAGIVAAVVLLLGIWAAALAARRLRAPELIVFLPAAAVLLGGIYMHDIQVIVAVPAALTAAARVAEPRRTAALLSLVVLTIVWTQYPGRAVLLVDIAAIAVACMVCIKGTALSKTVTAALYAVGFAAAILLFHRGDRVVPASQTMAAIAPTALAATAWQAYLDATPSRTASDAQQTGQKIPLWFGIAVLFAVSVRRE
jgi:hypothetical protein